MKETQKIHSREAGEGKGSTSKEHFVYWIDVNTSSARNLPFLILFVLRD